jgi:O-acetyl-ADP-ribose deacetylase (regulator of RNase III)
MAGKVRHRRKTRGYRPVSKVRLGNVQLRNGDITTARVDAIVNAANSAMLGGGGVDGAIHRAAGPMLLEACHQVEAVDGLRCLTGEARITSAGNLQARYVIHTVGPRYHIDPEPEALLTSAYRNTFELALDNNCRTMAVPAISCGVYGYPLDEAAKIALGVSAGPAFSSLDISFYLFNQEIYDIWAVTLGR